MVAGPRARSRRSGLQMPTQPSQGGSPLAREVTTWPGDRKVAVMVTVALELWSEGHWPVYAPMAAAWPLPGVPDAHSVSWSEYGATTGVWRLLDIMAARGMLATFGTSSAVADRFPDAVLAVHAAGHEIAAHSVSQDVLPVHLDVSDERDNIRRCVDTFEALTGARPADRLDESARDRYGTHRCAAHRGRLLVVGRLQRPGAAVRRADAARPAGGHHAQRLHRRARRHGRTTDLPRRPPRPARPPPPGPGTRDPGSST